MGLECFHCETEINGGLRELFVHFRAFSLLRGNSFTRIAVCNQDGCKQTFHKSYSFKRHLQKIHRLPLNVACNDEPAAVHIQGDDLPGCEHEQCEEGGGEIDIADRDADIDTDEDWDHLDEQELTERALMLVCKLKSSSSVSQSVVSNIVQDVTQLCGDLVGNLKETTKAFLVNHDIDTQSEAALLLFEKFEMFQNPFHGVETDYKQQQYLLASKMFVPPVAKEITLGYAPRTDSATGNVLQLPTPRVFHYISIKKVVKLVVEQPGFWECVEEHRKSTDGVMRDFHDGDYCAAHHLFMTRNCLKLVLYNDDVEMTNPLSPKAGSHKLGVLYYTFKDIHPCHLSTLSHFYLAALYKSSDVSEFGFDVILQPLVDELKELESVGMEIDCPSFQGIIKVGLAQVIGDNLGIHSILGFAQGFTANYFCRKCKGHRDNMRMETKLSENLNRTVENYTEDLLVDNLPLTGVRTSCLLNELESFHVTKNYAPDIMHDMLEGVCPLELKLVLCRLIENRFFDLNTLNGRISSFNYGFPDNSNKPCTYSWSSLVNADGSPGQNAAQMWTLMRHIGLMIGDLVPEGNDDWELLLLLFDCMDIIFSPAISPGDCIFMRHLISDHHELFLELFPDRHLKPKHHFMLHYAEAALKIGPLINYWSMRFEAKHNFFRRLSHIVCNFKSITRTMAYRHQMYLCYQLLSKQSFKEASLEIGPGSCVLLNSIPDCQILSNLLGMYPLFGDVFVAKWAVVHGTKYRKGMMVAFDRTDDQCPVYARIRDVIVVRDVVHLVLEKWETLHFVKHFHAYAVRPVTPSAVTVSTINRLLDYHPLHAVQSYTPGDTTFYISPRYRI